MNPAGTTALTQLLSGHRPADPKEEEDLAAMRRWAERLESPFSRHQGEAHFTGSAIIVDEGGERVCLVHHLKLGRWLQPGGHAEPQDEGDLRRTALREAAEETGLEVELHPLGPRPLDVDCHRIPGKGEEPGHFHLDVRFLVRARESSRLVHDPLESHGAEWVPWSEALARAQAEPAFLRVLEKAQRLVRPAS